MSGRKDLPTIEEAVAEIRAKPVVSPWPVVGLVLGLSRGATYDAVARGEIETVRYGRLLKAITAPLRRKLGLDEATSWQSIGDAAQRVVDSIQPKGK